VIGGALAVLTAVLLVILVLWLAQQRGAKVNLSRPTVDLGKASDRSADVARSGPLKFLAPSGRSDLFVQHLGPDPGSNWLAFEVRQPGEPRTCVLRWQPATHDFIDPCDNRNFPADGTGLVHYPVRVDDKGHVLVDAGRPIGSIPPSTH
jgi:hypothetical protein